MSNTQFEERAARTLRDIDEAGTRKRLRHVTGPMGATVRLEDAGEAIVLCSNNYLGLANHPEVVAASRAGLDRYGAGTASVRFICGTFDAHRTLEEKLAGFSGTEAALSYVSCWTANEAAIATAVGPKDVILSDELNHASIIELLIQRSRTSLFSNALPVPVACGASAAIDVLQRDTTLIDRLRSNTARIREGLTGLGFEVQESPSAIAPIMIGDEAEAIRKSERLLELGVWVVAFGFPVVPKGAARLRVQVSAALKDAHLDKILDAFGKL